MVKSGIFLLTQIDNFNASLLVSETDDAVSLSKDYRTPWPEQLCGVRFLRCKGTSSIGPAQGWRLRAQRHTTHSTASSAADALLRDTSADETISKQHQSSQTPHRSTVRCGRQPSNSYLDCHRHASQARQHQRNKQRPTRQRQLHIEI